MGMEYVSTRNSNEKVSPSMAILNGLSPEGGLYVPSEIPRLDVPMNELKDMGYRDVAYEVMKLWLSDFTEDELRGCIERAYDDKFDVPEISPLRKADGAYFLELFHGATIAFKDMALSILPHLMITSAKKNGLDEEIVILTATSGDTGKAALAGFAGVEGTRIMVFYPKGGVSPIQEKQMVSQVGKNTRVVGIHGNFDEAQTGVKKMFTDEKMKTGMKEHGFVFSSANSINIGRLVPQIVYYVYAYTRLLADGEINENELINIDVPTGNFGNILAAYYARCMGLPVKTLICASNENKVLYDFFKTGIYDKNREFILTSSPSMDILISSNLERLIYHITGDDAKKNFDLMKSLQSDGKYEATGDMMEKTSMFYGNWCDEGEVASTIKRIYDSDSYVIDTHTAVAAGVYDKYRKETGDKTPTVIASTASPFKFTKSVMGAIDKKYLKEEDFSLMAKLEKIAGVPIPKPVANLKDAPILHDFECDIEDMPKMVEEFLK